MDALKYLQVSHLCSRLRCAISSAVPPLQKRESREVGRNTFQSAVFVFAVSCDLLNAMMQGS